MKKLFLLAAASWLAISSPAQTPVATSAADQLGWQLAVHSYTFRKFSISDAIDKTAALGVHYMSVSGNVNLNGSNSVPTMSLSEKQQQAILDKLKMDGISPQFVNMGVMQLPPDETKCRQVFEFAKRLGIDTLVAEPATNALDTVEKLCKEYNIRVAIHNHPQGHSIYWNPDSVLAAIKGRTPLLGACADVGHWMRSGLDPVECLKKLDGHIFCLHFKDLNEMKPDAHDVPWGTGIGQTKALMAELKRQHFRGAFCVEYEYHWETSQPEIAECVKFFNATCNELVAAEPGADAALKLPITPGQYAGTLESLTNYACPDWFRDAKFGIWAHWGPQSVPMEGDWYARKMYQEGSPDYKDHLARYGHPSTNGWKDIIPLWKAEKWEPEKLMALYKKAGAKYFVSMGTHHDDFFLWNSKLHKWNAVNYGPHRDVVGEWQAAAKKNGLPFGVSEHLGASFTWFQDSHKADKTGPFAGVPYDGANSNNWDLYHFPAEPGDTKWYSNDPRWHQQWYDEIKELVDDYHPDLLYSDGGVAFGSDNVVGLSQIANLYNDSLQQHHGKLMAVYNCKQISDGRWVQDYERGGGSGIDPYPWQNDTSIGDWFYNKHWKYQPLSWTVRMLVDITSKNGNLLLNVVLRPDGTLDPEVETMLHELADWTAVNGEAIYGTRPWLIYGEGSAKVEKSGNFNDTKVQYSAKDIRFTTKGKTLYAIALGWPEENQLTIRALAKTDDASVNVIKRVVLLGYKGKLKFTQTTEGLTVQLPDKKISDLTCSLKITGSNLKPVTVP